MDSKIINLTDNQEKPNLSADFEKFMSIKDKGYDATMPCNLHFFEWSDVNQEKLFDDHDKFIRWLSTDCKIYSKWEEDKKIKLLAHTEGGVWIICRTGSKDLIIEDSLAKMKAELAKPHVTPVYRPTPSYSQYPNYAEGGRYGEYDPEDFYD